MVNDPIHLLIKLLTLSTFIVVIIFGHTQMELIRKTDRQTVQQILAPTIFSEFSGTMDIDYRNHMSIDVLEKPLEKRNDFNYLKSGFHQIKDQNVCLPYAGPLTFGYYLKSINYIQTY